MAMRVLIDTNILIDFILRRAPYSEYAVKIIAACDRGALDGCIAAHSIINIDYILRKNVPQEERRNLLRRFCEIFTVQPVGWKQLAEALADEKFGDFEDCLQWRCAAAFNADCIITRNVKDFATAGIPAILRDEFCRRHLSAEEGQRQA